MSEQSWPGIRPGSRWLSVYNEALLVYLLDEASVPELIESGADFESGFAEDEQEEDSELLELARRGLYVAYQLEQDDEIAVEIVVGAPLKKKELAAGRWLAPQKAFLRLPSGRLRVDSANTFPLYNDDPEDEPGIVDVPPGNYLVTLYRLDYDELTNEGLISEDEPWQGPQEVIVLTPTSKGKAVTNLTYLRFPEPAVTEHEYAMEEGVFRGAGMTRYWWDQLWVNLDRPAAAALQLVPGRLFRLQMHGFEFRVVYLGEVQLEQVMDLDWARPMAEGCPEFGVAYRLTKGDDWDKNIRIVRLVSTTPFPIHERWLSAVVTPLPETVPLPWPSSPGSAAAS